MNIRNISTWLVVGLLTFFVFANYVNALPMLDVQPTTPSYLPVPEGVTTPRLLVPEDVVTPNLPIPTDNTPVYLPLPV